MTSPKPVLFIHGLWLHASSWEPWIELFEREGYAPSAPGWPGDPATVAEARANPESIADHGIDDVVEHFAGIIRGLEAPPILIGHSFGGMIAQKLLGQDLGARRGSPSTPRRSRACCRCRCPRCGRRCRCSRTRRTGTARCRSPPTSSASRSATRCPRTSPTRCSNAWTIPPPGKPLFEAAAADFNPHSPAKVATGMRGRGPSC
ncbi:alpha/beta hydrolase [Yinghuangia aomiensis]